MDLINTKTKAWQENNLSGFLNDICLKFDLSQRLSRDLLSLVSRAVYKWIQQVSHHQGAGHIHNGMLLQHHGRHTDGNHQDKRSVADPAFLPQRFAVHHGDVNADGVKHVNTWENVGGSICRVEIKHQLGAKILIRVHQGPQIRSIWENGTDEKADGHTRKQVGTQPVIVLLVGKEEKQDGSGHVGKP